MNAPSPVQPAAAVAAILLFVAAPAPAQTSSAEPTLSPTSALLPPGVEGPEVTIRSASGRERRPLIVDDVISRTGLRPRQVVEIKLRPKAAKKGDPVTVSSFDGGIVIGQESLAVLPDGIARFRFQAGEGAGLYRLFLETGPEQYWLHFYVLDLNNPERNPGRVRIFE